MNSDPAQLHNVTLPKPEADGLAMGRRKVLLGFGSIAVAGLSGCGGGGSGTNGEGSNPSVGSTVEYWSGVATQSTAAISARTFSAKWTTTLVPEVGTTPTWATGPGLAVPTVRDCFGYVRHARLGEARFWGARRVENKLKSSADFQNDTYWWSAGTAQAVAVGTEIVDAIGKTQTFRLSKTAGQSSRVQNLGILPSVEHAFSIYARADSLSRIYLQFYIPGGAVLGAITQDILPGSWVRVQVNGVPDGVSECRVFVSPGEFGSQVAGSIFICHAQLEDVSGLPSAVASEYVSNGMPGLSPIYHGAMVDGVKYFDSYCGNTYVSGFVKEASGSKIPATTLRFLRLDPQAVNLCSRTESFSNWSAAGMSLSTIFSRSPRCDRTTVLATGTEQSQENSLTQVLSGVALGAPITFSCFAKAQSAPNWFRLRINLSDGSGVTAYFELSAGTAGELVAAASRQAWAHIEPWADGWYRCVVTTSNSASGTAAVSVVLGTASGNGTELGGGSGVAVQIWGAHAAPVEYPPSYIPNSSSAAPVTRQSQSVTLPNSSGSVLGLQNYVVTLESVLGYYSGITIKGGTTPAWRPFWYARASGSLANQHRLGVGLRPTTVAFFGDRYLGDPNPLYFWKPNTAYRAGDIVIPTDTQLDNANRRKMFVCVVAGISGASEPTWIETFVSPADQSTALTADGSVRWQNNHDNTLLGMWEPYDTSILDQGYSAFSGSYKAFGASTKPLNQASSLLVSVHSAPGAYGYAVNGSNATLRTAPFPIDGTPSGDLHQSMESITFGRLSESATSHPLSIGNVVISSESITPEVNRQRTVRAG